VSGLVYKIVRRETGHEYVGLTGTALSKRWGSHKSAAKKGRESHLYNAMRKYGNEAFDCRLVAKLPTVQEAQIAERILIAFEQPHYNIRAGGEGGGALAQQTKEKLREAGRRHQRTPEARARMAAVHTGRVLSDDHRTKVVTALQNCREAQRAKAREARSTESNIKRSLTLKADPQVRARMQKAREARWAKKVVEAS
jgi:group I intron endonuclease